MKSLGSFKFLTRFSLFLLLGITLIFNSQAQEVSAYKYQPILIKNKDSQYPYVRLLLWTQVRIEDGILSDGYDISLNIKRSRMLAYGQLSPRLLLVTHIGINNLSPFQMDPLGSRNSSESSLNTTQLFLHAAWSEYKITRDNTLYIGAGLHYWNGLSRFSAASTINFMTMDNYRQSWAQLGLSDQFARHIGIYAKGEFRKLRYSFAVNQAINNALGSDILENLPEGSITYSGNKVFGERANMVYTGRLEYQLLDQESALLPYRTGTYLGTKKILTIGAGFFNHRNGTVYMENGPVGNDVTHFAADIFYDAPLGEGAVNLYTAYYQFDYGENFSFGTTYGSGHSSYGQLGYLLPLKLRSGQFMPYLAYSQNHFDAYKIPAKLFQLGINWFIHGHNAKLTLEYRYHQLNSTSMSTVNRNNGLSLQTQIYL